MPSFTIINLGLKASLTPDYLVENEQVDVDVSTGKPVVRQRISAPDVENLLEEVLIENRVISEGNAGQQPDAAGRTRMTLDFISAGLTLATITTVGTVTTVSTVTTVTTVANTQQADGYRLALDQFYAAQNAEAGLRSRIAVT